MCEFEDIPHSGGKITFSNGSIKYEFSKPQPLVMYDIYVSLNGIVLARGDLINLNNNPEGCLKVMLISDMEGWFGYLCPRCNKYFRATRKIKPIILCPYCIYIDEALKFLTPNQMEYMRLYLKKYIEHLHTREDVLIDCDELLSQLDNNTIDLHKYETRQQQTIESSCCNIKYDIIGVHASCPGCGKRNSFSEFLAGLQNIKKRLAAGELTENESLNRFVDHYSGFGDDIKYILGTNIPITSKNKKLFKEINFQRIIESNTILVKLYNLELFPDTSKEEKSFLTTMFQKRHLIAHKSAVVDREYLEKTSDNVFKLGQKISVKKDEIIQLIDLLEGYSKIFFDQFESLISDYTAKAKKI